MHHTSCCKLLVLTGDIGEKAVWMDVGESVFSDDDRRLLILA